MSAAEGCFYLDVPNILMVQSSEKEAPWGQPESPLEQYTVALRLLKRMVRSVTGSGGFHKAEETAEVLDMAKCLPNFRGVMLDNFFFNNPEKNGGKRGELTLKVLEDVRRRLDQTDKKLDTFCTFYVNQFDLPLKDYIDLIDVLTIWNMESEGIQDIEDNLQKLRRIYPDKRKMLDCYLVDYPKMRGMSVDLMKHQRGVGLRWLQKGRIEGIVFMGNTVMDLGFESVEWAHNWIRLVGHTKLI